MLDRNSSNVLLEANWNGVSHGKGNAAGKVAGLGMQEQPQPVFTYEPLEDDKRILHPLTRTSARSGRPLTESQELSGNGANGRGITILTAEPCKPFSDSEQSVDETAAVRATLVPNHQQVLQEDMDKARGRLSHFSRLSRQTKGTDVTLASLTIRALRIRFTTVGDKDTIFDSIEEVLQVNPDLYQLLLAMTGEETQDLLRIYNAAKGELQEWGSSVGFPAFLKAEDQRPYPMWKKQGDREYFKGWVDLTIVPYTSPSTSWTCVARVYHDLIEAVFAGRVSWCSLQRVLQDWDLYPKMQYGDRLAWLKVLIIISVIRPPGPSCRPPADITSTVHAKSGSTICVATLPSNASLGKDNVAITKGSVIPGTPATNGSRNGKAGVKGLVAEQSSAPAKLSSKKNASPATLFSAKSPSTPTEIHSTLDATQQLLSEYALGLCNSPAPRQRRVSPRSNSQISTDRKQGGCKIRAKRGRRGGSVTRSDDRSVRPSSVDNDTSVISQSVHDLPRHVPAIKSKPRPAQQTHHKVSGKPTSASPLQVAKEVLAHGVNSPAAAISPPVQLASRQPPRSKKTKVKPLRNKQQQNGSEGKGSDKASGPVTPLGVQRAPGRDISTAQPMAPASSFEEESSTLNAAQPKHSGGLRLSCSDPELGDLEIIGAGFKACFPHLQLCDHDPRYTYIWHRPTSDIGSPDIMQLQSSTLVTSTTWDDLEIQFTDNPIPESFLRTIRGNSSPILFDDTASMLSGSGSPIANMCVFHPESVGKRYSPSAPWVPIPGTETLNIPMRDAEMGKSDTMSSSITLNPCAAAYTPTAVDVPVGKGALDDAVEPEPSLTPPPGSKQHLQPFHSIARHTPTSQPTGSISPPTDYANDIGRKTTWKRGKHPRFGKSVRAPPAGSLPLQRPCAGGKENPGCV
ncbi:hypothetical protein QFC22_005310 [Naganishia vaughanmartiniae]|uniref:Uncharacterized protein n=1 Tax=Naganishia vaughanmartiniae TaxID=1424756 RepID=A0ACC2WTM4_9TREE|nr:hypothetical protein QFC22_005310 [Naganishia vaughanmartiniae]